MLRAVPHREIHDFIFVLVKTLFVIPVPRVSVCLFSPVEAAWRPRWRALRTTLCSSSSLGKVPLPCILSERDAVKMPVSQANQSWAVDQRYVSTTTEQKPSGSRWGNDCLGFAKSGGNLAFCEDFYFIPGCNWKLRFLTLKIRTLTHHSTSSNICYQGSDTALQGAQYFMNGMKIFILWGLERLPLPNLSYRTMVKLLKAFKGMINVFIPSLG